MIVGAGGVLWWLRSPAPVEEPGTTPTATPVAQATPKSAQPKTITHTLFVPNEQALLSKTSVTEQNALPSTPTWETKASHTLKILFKHLKDLPRGTKVLGAPTRDKKGIVTINFSREFRGLDTMHETPVALVLDSVACTLGAIESPEDKPVKLRILVEGKPLHTLSEYDLSQPWTSSQPMDETAPSAEDTV